MPRIYVVEVGGRPSRRKCRSEVEPAYAVAGGLGGQICATYIRCRGGGVGRQAGGRGHVAGGPKEGGGAAFTRTINTVNVDWWFQLMVRDAKGF